MRVRRVTTPLILVLLALIPWCVSSRTDGPAAPSPPSADPSAEPVAKPAVPAADPEAEDDEPGTGTGESEPSLVVAGAVISQDGVTPAVGAKVVYYQDGDSPVQIVGTREGGRFRIKGLKPGIVELIATPYETIDGADGFAKVTAGDEAVRIVLEQRGLVRIEVRDAATGELVTDLIRIVGDDGSTLHLAEEVLQGHQWVLKLRPGKPLRFRVVADGYRTSKLYDFRYDRKEPNRLVRVVLPPAPERMATIVLMPRLPSGYAAKYVQVTRHFGGPSSRKTRAVRGGIVELSLPPGPHDVEVWPGRRRPPWWVPVRFSIDAKPGERIQKEIPFVRGGVLTVRGPDPDAPPPVELVRNGRDGKRPDETEVEGGVNWRRIGPLEPGVWTVRSPGHRAVEARIEAGQETAVHLELR